MIQYIFTERFGGYSKAPYDSFNIAHHVGDDPVSVSMNRHKLLQMSGAERLIFMDQVHKDRVVHVKESSPQKIESCDSIISNTPGLGLCVMVADCLPILMYDVQNGAIGAVHAGRAGSYLNISAKTIEAMHEVFGTKAEDVKVYIGPGIHSCCYEVSKEIIEGFEAFSSQKDGSVYLDLLGLNKSQLQKVGVLEKNIDLWPICTSCDESYFSYRRDGVCGRFCGCIVLTEDKYEEK